MHNIHLKFILGNTKAFALGKELAYKDDIGLIGNCKIATSQYTGNGSSPRTITISFRPYYAMVYSSTSLIEAHINRDIFGDAVLELTSNGLLLTGYSQQYTNASGIRYSYLVFGV